MLATPVLAEGAAFYRHPSLTMREVLRFRLLPSGASEHTIDVGGLPVRYFESTLKAPRSNQGTLVLVHGFGDSAETWSLVLPRLKHEWRIVAPDVVGFGRTPIPPEGMRFSVLIDYFSRFLDAVGVQKAALAGNSLGGAISIRYAAEHQEKVSHLFLLDSAGLHPGATIHAPQAKTHEEARQIVKAASGMHPRYVPNFVLDDIILKAQEPARQQYRNSDEPTDVSESLSLIKAPTTVIRGELDELIPAEHAARMHAEIQGSELIELPGVGHVPQLQAPKRLAEIVRTRLDDLVPRVR